MRYTVAAFLHLFPQHPQTLAVDFFFSHTYLVVAPPPLPSSTLQARKVSRAGFKGQMDGNVIVPRWLSSRDKFNPCALTRYYGAYKYILHTRTNYQNDYCYNNKQPRCVFELFLSLIIHHPSKVARHLSMFFFTWLD